MIPKLLTNTLTYVFVLIIILVPFQAFATTWLGATFGHLDLFRAWKELALVAMSPLVVWVIWRNDDLRRWLISDWLSRLSVAYVFLHGMYAAYALVTGTVTLEATVYALIINLRLPIFVLLAMVVVRSRPGLAGRWRQLVLVPAVVVVVFGLLQMFVLPTDFLTHFGYGAETIPAIHTVDQKDGYIRIQSILRGPNPLGAYMVVILTVVVALLAKDWRKHAVRYAAATATLLVVLFGTYSRSAYIGAAVSLTALGAYHVWRSRFRQLGVVVLALLLVAGAGSIWLLRNNDFVQNVAFHTDETSVAPESSNQARTEALTSGLVSVIEEPLGRGPGTAGPASNRNDRSTRIAENYFIQIAQEVGVVGLALFMGIYGIVAYRLWLRRRDTLALILLSSLLGLTVVNMLSHAWTDDTLAYVFWGLAGLALASLKPDILVKD